MNGQITKRKNPFATPIRSESEQETKETVVEKQIEVEQTTEIKNETVVEHNTVEEVAVESYEEPVISKPVAKPQGRPTRQTARGRAVELDDDNREKFTSTMEITLRRRIKIVCAKRGIMFSAFVEEACKEKLKREGE